MAGLGFRQTYAERYTLGMDSLLRDWLTVCLESLSKGRQLQIGATQPGDRHFGG